MFIPERTQQAKFMFSIWELQDVYIAQSTFRTNIRIFQLQNCIFSLLWDMPQRLYIQAENEKTRADLAESIAASRHLAVSSRGQRQMGPHCWVGWFCLLFQGT